MDPRISAAGRLIEPSHLQAMLPTRPGSGRQVSGPPTTSVSSSPLKQGTPTVHARSTRTSNSGKCQPASSSTHLPTQHARQSKAYPKSSSSKRAQKYFRSLCRSLHLDILFTVVAKIFGFEIQEEEKIAFRKDRAYAALHLWVHIFPVAAALAIVVLNLRRFYIGRELSGETGQDAERLAGLLFAAKLHELLMLASIGTILFHFLRQELAFGNGVPFGALFAGQQFASISTLWSMEFWGVVYDAWKQKKGGRRRRWALVSLIFTCIILGVAVGPSTANLMRPRLDYWPAGGTTFWINATSNAMFPERLEAEPAMDGCLQDTGDPACPYGDYAMIMDGHQSYWPELQPMGWMPSWLYVSSARTMRKMSFLHRTLHNGSGTIWPQWMTVAYVPPPAVADGLSDVGVLWAYAAATAQRRRRWWSRKDVQYAVESFQPIVSARCDLHETSDSHNRTVKNITFANLGSAHEWIEGGSAYLAFSDYEELRNDSVSSWLEDVLYTQEIPQLLWIDEADTLNRTSSTLLAIAAFPHSILNRPTFYCCSLNSRFVMETLLDTRETPLHVSGTTMLGLAPFLPMNKIGKETFPSAAWAAYTNAYSASLGLHIFPQAARTAGLWNTSRRAAGYNSEFAVEAILTSMLANGIARTSYGSPLAGSLKGMYEEGNVWAGGAWTDEFLPKAEMGYGGNAFDVPREAQETATQFTMKASAYGYAYGREGTAQIAAAAVLLVYCIIAISYGVYIVWTGWSSDSWNSASELTSIALNSERTTTMYNTGAGIHAISTFEEEVRIRARASGLELIFDNAVIKGQVPRIGETYG